MISPSSAETEPSEKEIEEATELVAKREELVTKFWDVFEEKGVAYAGDYLFQQLQGSIQLTQFILPELAVVGDSKGHSLSDLVNEWNEIMEKRKNDTTTANNDGGGVHRVGSCQTDGEPTEDESEQPSDADGNARKEAGDDSIS